MQALKRHPQKPSRNVTPDYCLLASVEMSRVQTHLLERAFPPGDYPCSGEQKEKLHTPARPPPPHEQKHTYNLLATMMAASNQPPKKSKHTTGGIPRWSPTLVLVARFSAYVWQSGRDAQFSLTYGRMC
jgi:hypothetical protein